MSELDLLKTNINQWGDGDTSLIEPGYIDHLNQLNTTVDEEGKTQQIISTPQQEQFDQQFQTEQVEQNLPQPVDQEEDVPLEPGQVEDKRPPRVIGEDGLYVRESVVHRNGNQFSDEKIKNEKSLIPLNPIEETPRKLLQNKNNLDDQLTAFNMIRSDDYLRNLLDFNGDGEYTFADMFFTDHWNGTNQPITEEQDAELTAQFIEGLENKSLAARINQLLASTRMTNMNRSKVVLDRRWRADADINDIPKGHTIVDTAAKGLLENAKDLLSLPEQLFSFATGGDFGGHDSRLDDIVIGHKREGSLAQYMMTPAYRQKLDGVAHEVAYWVPEAIQVALTLGAGSKSLVKLTPKLGGAKKLLALKAARFIDPAITTRNVLTGRKAATMPAKIRNFVATGMKGGALETFKGSMARDFSVWGMGANYEDPTLKRILDAHPDAWIFGHELQWAIDTPLGKRYAYYMDEAVSDGMFATGLYGLFGKVIPKTVKGTWRLGGNAVENFRTSTTQMSLWPGHERGPKHWFTKRSQKLNDIDEIASVSLKTEYEGGNNALYDAGLTDAQRMYGYSPYANGNIHLGQATVHVRSGVNQIINDADEIATNVIKRPGTVDELLTPLQKKEGVRDGLSEAVKRNKTQEFVEDSIRKAQIDSLDPTKRTNIGMNEGTLRRMMETIDRDAGSLEPREFWGDIIADEPLSTGAFGDIGPVKAWSIQNMQVADAINQSLLVKLRDLAATAGEMEGKTDIFAREGIMKRVADNLTLGLSEVKKTRYTWNLMKEQMGQSVDGRITPDMVENVSKMVMDRSRAIHDESTDGVRLMMQMLKGSDSDELAHGVLEVFRNSNKIQNFKDFDAWMRQKIRGGEFDGKVKTGALVKELQGVMINSILSGPKTPLRAILGTTTNAYYNAINEAAGAFLRQPFTNDVASRMASYAKLKGMFEILPEAWQIFKQNLDGKFNADFANIRTRFNEPLDRAGQNYELFKRWTERNGTDADKAALYLLDQARTLNNNKLLSWSPRVLAAVDDTFKWLMARARSKEKGIRQVLEQNPNIRKFDADQLKQAEDNFMDDFLDEAGNIDLSKDSWLKKQFEEVTLTSELKGFSSGLDRLMKDYPLVKPFYLFARTGINGLNLSFKNTPLLGVLHKESIDILSHNGEDFASLMKYGIENAEDLANARNLIAGRQAVGSTVVSGMAGMYMANQLTGNGPADKQLKQSWVNAGWKPNHIYVGNLGFDYSSLEPFNVIFSSIADIGDNIELMGSEWAEKRLQAVAFVIGRGLTGKTYMSGLDQLMQIVQNPAGPATSKAFANILNNSVPLAGARNEFGKWINPHMKELDSDMWTSIRNRNQLFEYGPGSDLPKKSDILNGQPINNWNILGRSFNAISPVQIDIRSDSPGRRLLMESNYDMKTTTYAFGGYSFTDNAKVRSHFQNAIGNSAIEYRGKTFKNLEEALNYLSTDPVIQASIKRMKEDGSDPKNWDINPNKYPHNTIINRMMNQAREKAWASMNQSGHPAYADVQQLKTKADGLDTKTRQVRQEILDLNLPSKKQYKYEMNPK